MRRGGLQLEIADNGRGFNPRARTEGFGLVGMRERASAIGGHLRVSRRIRKPGTRVTLVVALPTGSPVKPRK
jgi:signal transduction histidine kinase